MEELTNYSPYFMGVVAIQTSYLRSIQIGYVLFLVSCVRSLSIDRTLCRLESFFGGVVNNSSNKRKVCFHLVLLIIISLSTEGVQYSMHHTRFEMPFFKLN